MGDINAGVDSSSVISPSAAKCLAQLGFTFAARGPATARAARGQAAPAKKTRAPRKATAVMARAG